MVVVPEAPAPASPSPVSLATGLPPGLWATVCATEAVVGTPVGEASVTVPAAVVSLSVVGAPVGEASVTVPAAVVSLSEDAGTEVTVEAACDAGDALVVCAEALMLVEGGGVVVTAAACHIRARKESVSCCCFFVNKRLRVVQLMCKGCRESDGGCSVVSAIVSGWFVCVYA